VTPRRDRADDEENRLIELALDALSDVEDGKIGEQDVLETLKARAARQQLRCDDDQARVALAVAERERACYPRMR
jgi:hypothetical protein